MTTVTDSDSAIVPTLADALRNLRARTVVLILDACQAGGALDSLASVAEVKLAIEDRVALHSPGISHDAWPSGVYVLAAATLFRKAIRYKDGEGP